MGVVVFPENRHAVCSSCSTTSLRFCPGPWKWAESFSRPLWSAYFCPAFRAVHFSEESNKQAVLRLKKTQTKSLSEYVINRSNSEGRMAQAAKLRPAQIRHLLAVTSATSRHPERDCLVLLLGITCGMRVSEIAQLEVQDVCSHRAQSVQRSVFGPQSRRVVGNDASISRTRKRFRLWSRTWTIALPAAWESS